MKLPWDIMVRMHRGELTPAAAFAEQSALEAGTAPVRGAPGCLRRACGDDWHWRRLKARRISRPRASELT
jgi:hypothetical protein